MKTSIIKTSFNTIALAGLLAFSQTALAEVAQQGSYKIDPAHTSINFSVSHLGTSVLNGRFNTLAGSLDFSPKGDSKVEVTIDTASVDTNHQKRNDHLKSPDFFNVKQFPEMKFSSNKVEYSSTGEPNKIVGTLSLHGETKPITLDVKAVGAGKDPWGGYRAGYTATTKINRSDYGMKFMQGGIGDEITIVLNIEAIKNK